MTKIFNSFLKKLSRVSKKKKEEVCGKIILRYLVSGSNSKFKSRLQNCKIKLGKIKRRWYSQGGSSNIISSPLGEISVPKMAFHELIFNNWSLWEKKTAIVCGATGRKYTYREVERNSKILAASFQNKLNLNKGDFAAMILFNCPEYPIAMLAFSQIGVVPTTVNPLYTVEEITLQFLDCKPKVILTHLEAYEKCVGINKALKRQLPIVVLRMDKKDDVPDGGIDFFEFFDSSTSGNLKPVAIEHDDLLVLPYSSGTTGTPKGVLLTHGNIISNLVQISHPETMFMNPTTRFHQDTTLGVLPMFHIYGMVVVTFYSMKEGCRLVVLPKFDPRMYMRNVVWKKVNILYVVPPLLQFLSHGKIYARYLRNVQIVINSASPMPLESAYKLLKKSPHVKIVQGYGMTEASPVLAHTSATRMQKLAAVGIPIASTKFKINNLDTGEAMPKGKTGELCVWGPQVMKGYLNRPEETKNAFDRDGWLRTGDIAYYDDDGDFFIIDRLKNLIKVKGFQVSPAELEEALLTSPKIVDAAVVGVKHKDFGEVPQAFVVLQEGVHMTEEEVKQIIKKKFSSHKHLKGGVKFVKFLPKNAIGKVSRAELKKRNEES